MFARSEILTRLERIERRLDGIEAAIASISREEELRGRVADKTRELDDLSRQSLHVVDLLDEARRRIRELESNGSA